MVNMIDRFISWIYTRRMFGPRCPDFERECLNCKAWLYHDDMFNSSTID